MQDNNPLVELDSEPLQISFGSNKSKSNGQHYRSIKAYKSSQSSPALMHAHSNSIHTINNSNAFIKSSQNTKSFSAIDFIPNSLDFPRSKALQPLDISITPVSIQYQSYGNKNENSVSNSLCSPLNIPMPPSLAPNTNNNSHFQYCTELNSYLVKDANIDQVSNNLCNILTEKFTEIDFETNDNNDQINGVVFMTSYSVFFTLQMYSENMNDTRFEFRRVSGDSLASAKFWSMIKGFMTPNNAMNDSFDMIALDLQMPKMDSFEQNNNVRMSDTEMDNLTQSLKNNDLFVVDELNFLYENMLEMPRMCADILGNKNLMTQLINESLLNRDICVQRIALLILDELAKNMGNDMVRVNGNGFLLFERISLLMKHKRRLIRRYTIQLLADLTVMKGWNINECDRHALMESIKMYENTAMKTQNYSEMIAKIKAKLSMNLN